MLGQVFARFLEKSPVSVMVCGMLERADVWTFDLHLAMFGLFFWLSNSQINVGQRFPGRLKTPRPRRIEGQDLNSPAKLYTTADVSAERAAESPKG